MTVLLVDDNDVNCRLFVDLLEYQGQDVRVAKNGQEALDYFKSERFDLILMDMQMPIMNGYEAICKIRSIEQALGGHTHIIAVTALAMDGDRERCLEIGADGYLSKPIRPREFLEMVEKVATSDQTASTDCTSYLDDQDDDEIVYDEALVLQRFLGKRELVEKVVVMFLERYTQNLTDIESAILSQDAEQLCQRAHGFKGLIGNFSTQKAFKVAQQLEEKGRVGEVDSAGSLYDVLKKEVEKLAAALRLTTQKK